jgi:ABC-type phosphate transport system substrate-binding protein
VRRRNILLAAGACLAALGLLAPAALADPVPSETRLLAGVGSDTTQFLMNDFANGNSNIPFGGVTGPNAHNADGLVIASYDASGGGNINSKTTVSGCSIARPVGSGAGIQALINARTAAGSGSSCLDFARSSANNSGFPTGTDLTWVPFAKDGLTMVLRNDTSLRQTYTKAFLTALYNCTLPPATQAQYQPLLPQAGSGTRSTFLNFIGVTTPGACVSDTINGVPILENNANLLTQPPMIIPHSIGQYYCQLGGACTNNTGNTHLTQINNILPNISDPNFPFLRVLYNVIPTQFATQPDATGTAAGTDPDYGPVFVGNGSALCSNNSVLFRNGFAPLAKPDPLLPAGNTGCGDVKSILGGGTAKTTGRPAT